MEKRLLLKTLVDSGTNIRRQVMPKAVISDKGPHQIGEFWDANKTLDVIVNGAHAVHDTVRELDEFTENQIKRLDNVKTSRIGWDDNNPITNITALTNAQIKDLKAGDIVIKTTGNEKHTYVVAYKKNDEMSLVYVDCWTVEEVYYEKHGNDWTYIQTDTFKPEDYYTKTQVDNKLAEKQDKITNSNKLSYSLVSDTPDLSIYLTEHQDLSSIIARIEALEQAINAEQTDSV